MINIPDLVRKNIRNLKPYSSARDEFSGKAGVFLDANENPFGELNRYPDPHQKALKNKLSELKKIPADQIFLGNGSDEIIDLSFRIFCEPGKDKAITFSPTYGMYDVSANINHIELLKVSLTNSFQIDRNMVSKCLNDGSIKLIFICSPNNPTGNIFNESDITYILENFKGIVVIDEAYIDFASAPSWINKTDQFRNLIVCQTFSKAWGLAGIRVGAAYANKEIIQFFNKVKPPYNISQLNQEAALNALENIDSFSENRNIILLEKERLIVELSRISGVNKIYPTDANFILMEVNEADKTYEALVEKKMIIRNRNKLVDNCLRITIGTPEENELFLSELKSILP